MALEDSLNQLRRATYIGKDFDTYVIELSQYIKKKFGDNTFNDFVESDLGIMFLELVAFANSTLSFYLDLQSGESYLETAKLRNSVVRLCRNIGFKMTGAVPATTSVQISMQTPKDFDVPIAAGTRLNSVPGLIFETLDSIKYTKRKNLTGAFTLVKRSNIVYAGSNIITPDATALPEEEIIFDQTLITPFTRTIPVSVIKRLQDPDDSNRLAISVNTTAPNDGTTLPKQIYIDTAFPDSIFPDDNCVFLENDAVGVAGNVGITKSANLTDPDFGLLGMGKGSTLSKAKGIVTVVEGANLVEDIGPIPKTITISDGTNPATTFEFDADGVIIVGNVGVSITINSTATDVANALKAAINGIGLGLNVTATSVGAVLTAVASGTPALNNPLQSGEVGPKIVNVREGQSVEEIFLSKGLPNQKFLLQNVPENMMIADETVHVYVDNVPYTEVEFMDFQQSNIFEAQLSSVPPLIRFGDGVAGNVPAENSEILVNYFATSGNTGNIPSEQINAFSSPVVVNFQSVSDLIVEQPETATGGIDYFALSTAKALAPYVFRSQDRAVTTTDYTALANTFTDPEAGAVGKAKAIIVRSIEDDFILQNLLSQLNGFVGGLRTTGGAADTVSQISMLNTIANIMSYWDETVSGTCKANIVQVAVLATDSYGRYRSPSAALLTALNEYLDERKEATVDVIAFDGVVYIVPVDIRIEIERETGFTKENVYSNMSTAVANYMKTLNTGDPLRLGDLYQTTEGVDGVSFSRIAIVSPADTTPPGAPIPGYEPAYYDETDLIVGALQTVEARDIQIVFLD
jgi:hypothetical protein